MHLCLEILSFKGTGGTGMDLLGGKVSAEYYHSTEYRRDIPGSHAD
jgi:hypothetical protein